MTTPNANISHTRDNDSSALHSSREPQPTGTAARVIELSRQIAQAPGAGDDLARAALVLACDVVPGARWASLTRRAGTPRTIVASDPEAEAVDVLHYEAGDGPCLAALDTAAVVVSDFATETRWPAFVARAVAGPARSVVSYPLEPAGHPATSLNIYSDTQGAFRGLALHTAALVAAGLGLALTAVAQNRRATNLEIGLATSRRIGAAVGILMQRHRWTYERGFDELRIASQRLHLKLHAVADHVVFTGELPA